MAYKQGDGAWYLFGRVEKTCWECNLRPFSLKSMRVIVDDRVHDIVDPETREQYVYVHDVVYSSLYID